MQSNILILLIAKKQLLMSFYKNNFHFLVATLKKILPISLHTSAK
ncbi:hypothetical protein SAMN05216353_10715 [Halobacillus alkaliphilus]|uniref:Uncharacterized protein n=1 Tax=Halobacillus alkaliphilus TaxID=396056 RepID=A0A1I2L096_9BACI|nr:hypothetical protein SAMN05216353_10715 [Halobacillus alkaliphilus]